MAIAGVLLTGCGSTPAERPDTKELSFKMVELDTRFRGEGAAVADLNRDGKLDVMTGEVWYEAPNWTMHEAGVPGEYDGATGYARAFFTFAHDMNGDGWTDLVGGTMQDQPFWWFENPRGGPGRWTEHTSDRNNWGEAPRILNLRQDGSFAMVSSENHTGHVYWAELPADGSGSWQSHVITGPEEPGQGAFRHGLGIGDINSDGRPDLAGILGWWETPEDRTQSPWPFHPYEQLAPRCANIEVVDLDGDGDLDLLTSEAHEAGVWWFEHLPGDDGEPRFERRLIDDSFTQSHSIAAADLDSDGDADVITGKRFWAHNNTNTDPGTQDPAVLYWYENTKAADGGLEFTRHLIHDDSGVGLQLPVVDLDGDGRLDLVISNKKGVRIFLQR